MDHTSLKGISIQVSLSGYSFKITEAGKVSSMSGWNSADKAFTDPVFQGSYDYFEISLMTPKSALVPEPFYKRKSVRELLSKTVSLNDDDEVDSIEIPEFGAELLYSLSMGETLSKMLSKSLGQQDGSDVEVLPEMFFILKSLLTVQGYNKILASYADGYLYLAVAQGRNLLFSNVFKAVDFTTAEYFIFLILKKLQLNPEVSSICFRTPLSEAEEMSLYRYFKGVERI